MKTRAAVAWEAGKPLEIELIDLDGPKAGEVLLRIIATGVCHTDAFTRPAMIRKAFFQRCSAMKAALLLKKSAPVLAR